MTDKREERRDLDVHLRHLIDAYAGNADAVNADEVKENLQQDKQQNKQQSSIDNIPPLELPPAASSSESKQLFGITELNDFGTLHESDFEELTDLNIADQARADSQTRDVINKIIPEPINVASDDQATIDMMIYYTGVAGDAVKKTVFTLSNVYCDGFADVAKEFNQMKIPESDFMVLAGNIGNHVRNEGKLIEFLQLCKLRARNVIYVPGNHEFNDCQYRYEETSAHLRKLCSVLGVVFLCNHIEQVDGIHFIGSPLWRLISEESFSKSIESFGKVLPDSTEAAFKFVDAVSFINNALITTLGKPVIVITHYLPTHQFLLKGLHNDARKTLTYMLNRLEIIDETNTIMWCCGHFNESHVSIYQKIKFVLNSYGLGFVPRGTSFSKNVETFIM